ncbi:MAG: insulinase family protein [Colwellia sp.]
MFHHQLARRLVLTSLAIAITTISACSQFTDNASNSNNTSNSSQIKKNEFSGELPISPRIMKGKFDNGITYIIRKNTMPEKRAELRLVINAGSILEDDNQQGFAHFVEHMAFNGTEDFAKQEIVDYVESIGMRFGAHLNAHTSFDETVYKLQLPTDDENTLEKGVHILENWAHKLSFDGEEIDKERGVVIEEMRARKGANDRIFNKQLPVVAKNSQYAVRLPIGKKEVLESGSHEDLIRFYNDWYRPDLMAVIAVGDFEPEQMKALFEKYFANIKPVENPKKRIVFSIPKNETPLITIETDPELPRLIATIRIKQPLLEPKNYQEYRTRISGQLYIAMLNARFAEISLKPETAFVGAGSSFNRNFDASSTFIIGAAIKPGQTKPALEAILREENRALQHGFTASELARAKVNIMRGFEKNAAEVDTVQSRSYASEYVRHFMKGEAILGREKELEVGKVFIADISLSEVNQLGATWFTDNNRIVTIAAPEAEKTKLPNEQQIIVLWDAVIAEKTTAYQDSVVASALMTKAPVAGSIINKHLDKNLNTHYWTLSNGAKVILKQTDFKKDQILFTAMSEGGNSLIDDEHYNKTLLAANAVDYMGFAEFDLLALNKFMQGKKFGISSQIVDLSESLKGFSSVQDIENFMQMLHLKFTKPRNDKQAFDTLLKRIEPSIENSLKQPRNVFNEAIRAAQYGDDPRHQAFDVARLKQQDLADSLAFYQQRFANAADFNFIFVGNVDLLKMEQLVTTYIASLPASKEREHFNVLPDNFKKGALNVVVNKGLEEKAQVQLSFYGKANFSHSEAIKFSAMKSALSSVLRERIREEKSGVYGVQVSGSLSRQPRETFNLTVSFTCDPVRADELISEVKKVLNEFQSTSVDEKYLISFKEKSHKSRENNLRENIFWKSHLISIERYQGDVLTFSEYDNLVDSISLKDIQQVAKRYLNSENNTLAKLLPEKKQDE